MKLSLDLRTALTQTLTPQQIQYLKLLQLPLVQLEQQVMQEIELNPMLEEVRDDEPIEVEITDYRADEEDQPSEKYEEQKYIADEKDPFEFQKLLWQDDSSFYKKNKAPDSDEEDQESFQIKDVISFTDDLMQQLRLIRLSDEEYYLAEQIIGNIDIDGYLRRDLDEIIDETNISIAEYNYNLEHQSNIEPDNGAEYSNPARQLSLSDESSTLLQSLLVSRPELAEKVKNEGLSYEVLKKGTGNGLKMLKEVDHDKAEKVLSYIRQLDPPGIGSRTVQECLVSQLEALPRMNAAQKLAYVILTETYDAFAKKHYHIITKQLGVSDEYLREAIEVIRSLNPKPGGGDYQHEVNTVIPDFSVDIDDDTGELLINVNDSRIPALKLSKAYEKLKKDVQYKLSNKETKEWIRNKYEDAKFLIQAIRQRKSTMLKVMTAIAYLQKDFFYEGPTVLKPLIYKNVAEKTGLDISTVCRIVNGKYVQTRLGTFELKYFFSESLPSDDGEDVSTRVIKQIIQDIVDEESKEKPYSDDKISKLLKEKGYNVARRTVAKYREQMKIPVARLRKEL